MNKWTVTLTKENGSSTEMNAVKETAQEAIEYVISKQAKRVREAIQDGEISVTVAGDAGNTENFSMTIPEALAKVLYE